MRIILKKRTLFHMGRWLMKGVWVHISLHYQPRDLWRGVYWKEYPAAIDVFVCILPMFPLEIYMENQHWIPK